MGALPDLLPGYQRVTDAEVRHRVAAVWGVEPPTYPGLRIPDMFDAAIDGRLRALYVMGEDIAQTDPDSAMYAPPWPPATSSWCRRSS